MGRPRRQAPSRDRLEEEAGEERACPSPVKHVAKSLIMLLVPGCIEPETASTVVNQQLDPRSCVTPGIVGRNPYARFTCPCTQAPASSRVGNTWVPGTSQWPNPASRCQRH